MLEVEFFVFHLLKLERESLESLIPELYSNLPTVTLPGVVRISSIMFVLNPFLVSMAVLLPESIYGF